MKLTRGDVFYISIELPNPEKPELDVIQKKLIVVVRANDLEKRVPFLIASTYRAIDVRPFEVLIRGSEGFFNQDTVIDCRWPYTMTRDTLDKGKRMFTLSQKIMTEVNLGLVVGLQM